MSDVPQVATWMGVPLSDIPRDQLENLLVGTWTELEELRKEGFDRSLRHTKDIARMAKLLHEARKPWYYKILDRIFS